MSCFRRALQQRSASGMPPCCSRERERPRLDWLLLTSKSTGPVRASWELDSTHSQGSMSMENSKSIALVVNCERRWMNFASFVACDVLAHALASFSWSRCPMHSFIHSFGKQTLPEERLQQPKSISFYFVFCKPNYHQSRLVHKERQ